MKKILFKSGINYSIKNFWQTLLSVIGIALGVAVVIAIDIANQSAFTAFNLSMESVSGKATHQIISNPPGIPDSIFFNLRKNFALQRSAPIIEKFIKIKGKNSSIFTLIGIDPLYEEPFRNYTSIISKGERIDLPQFLTIKGAALILESTAKDLGLSLGDKFDIEIDGNTKSLILIGMLKPESENQAKLIENIIITDISNAQEILNYGNFITRIDLIIEKDDTNSINLINAQLPKSLRIQKSETRSNTGRQITESFRINLTALSLLALIVGMFLIYNTMTFSVVQRKQFIGLQRSIGVTKKEIFTLIILESLTVGMIGTVLGIFTGIILGTGIINLVTKTINDMYFVLQVQKITISYESILKGIILGLSATLLSAYKPARDATNVPPRAVLTRSESEDNIKNKTKKYLFVAIISIIIGTLILLIDSKNIYFSYLGIAPIIVGFALFTPYFLIISMKLLTPIMKFLFGSIGKMASRGISSQLSRTTIAVAALSIAVSAAIGVGTMVSSFRQTVVDWLNMRLKADIYTSVPTMVSRFNDGSFDMKIADSIWTIKEVKAMNYYRENQINDNGKIKHILAAKVQNFDYEYFKDNKISNKVLWKDYSENEGVFVSESYAYKNGAKVGDTVSLPTNYGRKYFRVIGIFIDFSSDIGLIMMHLPTYQKYFDDYMLSGLAIFVKDKSKIEDVINEIREKSDNNLDFIVRSNRKLIDASVEIFDRTFLITNVLQLLAIIVSFIGILSALMALQLEKARELGVLRAIGMLPMQLWKMIILQTGIMGLIAGFLAIPFGNILAYILIHIINHRSFGWTIEYFFKTEYAIQGILISIFAAIIAGIYPSYKMSKTSPSNALRLE